MKGAALLFLALAAASCGRRAAAGAAEDGAASAQGADGAAASLERDPRTEELWERAKEGDADDLARLYDREGDTGLVERGALPAYRATALAALGFAPDFAALPWLAKVASSGTDAEAEAALESARSIAARPRPERDPEDALELREGCTTLRELAASKDASRVRRDHAVSILRMLAPFGCGVADADLDAK